MTRKQIRKLADQIIKFELINQDKNSSKEAKAQAKSQIIQLSSMFEVIPNGFSIMMEVDELVQKKLDELKEKEQNGND